MIRRILPGTDLSLSVVGMGCWTIAGEHWGPTDDAESVATIRAAVEAGISWFDTAPVYGRGHADRLLRRALGAHIDSVVIATKVGVRWEGEPPPGKEGHVWSDLRPQHVIADCEASLRRLKEPLDLLQVHWPCELGTPLDDTIAALETLQDRGAIRHWGLCNHDADAVTLARRTGRIASLQTPYSLVRRELEGPLLRACLDRMPAGVAGSPRPGPPLGILAYETLCRGLLTRSQGRPPDFAETDLRTRDERFFGARLAYGEAVARDLAAIGRKLGVSGAAIAAGWAAQRPGITAAIVGARRPEQIREVARAGALVERPKVWAVVDQAVSRHGRPP